MWIIYIIQLNLQINYALFDINRYESQEQDRYKRLYLLNSISVDIWIKVTVYNFFLQKRKIFNILTMWT